MPDYEVMAHQIHLPIAAEDPLPLPAGWEPFTLASRQGNVGIILCRRVVGAPPPDGGAPVLTSLTPSSLPAGSTPASVDVVGSGFDASCTVYADSSPRTTFFIDATHLQYTARPDLVAAPETRQITVQGDGGTSNALTFNFT